MPIEFIIPIVIGVLAIVTIYQGCASSSSLRRSSSSDSAATTARCPLG